MKIKQGLLRSGFMGYKVVDIESNRTVFASVFKAECEQFVFVHNMMKGVR